MLIYIDTDSGTWGIGENNLAIFDATFEEVEALMEMADSEICAFGLSRRLET